MPTQRPGRSEQDVRTPMEFLRACRERWGRPFAHDLAASLSSSVAPTWFGPQGVAGDALAPETNWQRPGLLWLNPPFGLVGLFAARCRRESVAFGPRGSGGAEILMLSPASVSTDWFAEHVHDKARVIFLRPRIAFVGHEQAFPKDLALFHFGPRVVPGFEAWRWKP